MRRYNEQQTTRRTASQNPEEGYCPTCGQRGQDIEVPSFEGGYERSGAPPYSGPDRGYSQEAVPRRLYGPDDYGYSAGGYGRQSGYSRSAGSAPGRYGERPEDYGYAAGGYGGSPGSYQASGYGPGRYGQGPADYGYAEGGYGRRQASYSRGGYSQGGFEEGGRERGEASARGPEPSTEQRFGQGGGYGQGFGWSESYSPSSQRSGSATLRRNRGPKGYTRSDERIQEDLSDQLMSGYIDASDVEIEVKNGVVALAGTVNNRNAKYQIEELADNVIGVKDVSNQLRIKREDESPRQGGTHGDSQGSSQSGGQGERENSSSAQRTPRRS